MFGIRRTDTTYTTHLEFWFDCWANGVGAVIDIANTLLGILSFGRLTTDWDMFWFKLMYREKP